MDKKERQKDRDFQLKEAERKGRIEKERQTREYEFRRKEFEVREKADLERTKLLFDLFKVHFKRN